MGWRFARSLLRSALRCAARRQSWLAGSPSLVSSGRSARLTPRCRTSPFRPARLLFSCESSDPLSTRRPACARRSRGSSSVTRLVGERIALMALLCSRAAARCAQDGPSGSSDDGALDSLSCRAVAAAALRCRTRSRAAKCRAAPRRTVTSSSLSLLPQPQLVLPPVLRPLRISSGFPEFSLTATRRGCATP